MPAAATVDRAALDAQLAKLLSKALVETIRRDDAQQRKPAAERLEGAA